jgi:hypothetical protein
MKAKLLIFNIKKKNYIFLRKESAKLNKLNLRVRLFGHVVRNLQEFH